MPKIIYKSFEDLLEDNRRLARLYVPEWRPESEEELGVALLKIFTHMQEEIVGRLNRVPEKNFAAFLDMLGIKLMAARPARVPVTFHLAEGLRENVFVPSATQTATAETKEHGALTYETVKGFTATRSSMEVIFSADPENDAIYSHLQELEQRGSFRFFEGENLQEHVLYMGHANLFKVGPPAEITLGFSFLDSIGIGDLRSWRWIYWTDDGEGEFVIDDNLIIKQDDDSIIKKDDDSIIKKDDDSIIKKDERRYSVGLKPKAEIKEREVWGRKSLWIACKMESVPGSSLPVVGSIRISEIARNEKLLPDLAFYNFIPLDLSKGFYPFGSQPRLFDAFYIASKEAFSKKGARVTMTFQGTCVHQENETAPGDGTRQQQQLQPDPPPLSWEYWDGSSWRSLETNHDGFEPEAFNGSVEFVCPEDLQETEVGGETSCWVRVCLISGIYGREEFVKREILKKVSSGEEILKEETWIVSPNFNPPRIGEDGIEIQYQLGGKSENGVILQHCLTYNNLEYRDVAEENRAGTGFKPFVPLPDEHPTLYLGFNSPLGKGNINIFFSVEEAASSFDLSPEIRWHYWSKDGGVCKRDRLETVDNTENLTKSETIELIGPSDQMNSTKFERDCYWIMGISTGCSPPTTKGIYPNSVWAEQVETIDDEMIGSGDGEKNRSYRFVRRPVISEEIWIREGTAIPRDDRDLLSIEGMVVQEVKNEAGKLVDSWVRWKGVDDFFNSGPKSRHYVLDEAAGEVTFGDGIRGMIPPIGTDNIRASYKSGGGVGGNVAIGEVGVLKTPIAGIDRIQNHVSAEGGSDGETMESVYLRGPHLIKHMDRAVTIEDFERLALDSSSEVARTRCFMDGPRLKMVVIPKGDDDRPTPAPGLLRTVKAHLLERCLNSASSEDIEVLIPVYREVQVAVQVIPKPKVGVVPLEQVIIKRLREYLHPLKGGLDGDGWKFGRDVHLSDIYSLLEGLEGVDHVENLKLNGEEEDVAITESEMICSGDHRITMKLGVGP